MKHAITIEALEVLDAIDCKGSFAAAAAHLYKVPSAITYTIQKLEQDLGLQVYLRKGRKAELTEAGKLLLHQGREILDATDRLAELARQIDSGWESTLTISVNTALGMDSVFDSMKRFYDVNPDIAIHLLEDALGGTWDALVDGRCDLAVGVHENNPKPSDFTSVHWQSMRWCFAVSTKHPLAKHQGPLSQADIAPYRNVIIRDTAINQPRMSIRLFSQKSPLTVPTLQAKYDAQRLGLGVGFLPSYLVKESLASGEMKALDIKDMDQKSEFYLAWPRGRKGKALRWFINDLQALAVDR